MKKDLDEGKEICFDLLQNSQSNSRQKNKYSAIQRQQRTKKITAAKQTWQNHWEPVMQVILKQFFVRESCGGL